MKYKVTKKQPNSKMCFVCGINNSSGLHADFYELENGELCATFSPKEQHQSYPKISHGGILSAILDETIGRAIMMKHDEQVWGVTIELNIQFKMPVPTDTKIRVVGRVIEENSKFFKGTGEIILPEGQVAVEGSGKFMKLPLDKVANLSEDDIGYKVISSPDDLVEIEL